MHARTFLRAHQLRCIVDISGLMAGVDEVGRGPLAGPVIAAAVILDETRTIRGLNDSKLLVAEERERLDREIRRKAICFSVASASVAEIDTLNILRAALLAMRRAVEGLAQQPQIVLVDGNQRPELQMPVRTVVGGDAKVRAISAASIIAKVHRDRLCMQLHDEHPQYGFDSHKGYSTPEHLSALLEHGACPHHRRSFAPVRDVLDRLF
jgi:ribonuclease HII